MVESVVLTLPGESKDSEEDLVAGPQLFRLGSEVGSAPYLLERKRP